MDKKDVLDFHRSKKQRVGDPPIEHLRIVEQHHNNSKAFQSSQMVSQGQSTSIIHQDDTEEIRDSLHRMMEEIHLFVDDAKSMLNEKRAETGLCSSTTQISHQSHTKNQIALRLKQNQQQSKNSNAKQKIQNVGKRRKADDEFGNIESAAGSERCYLKPMKRLPHSNCSDGKDIQPMDCSDSD